MRKIYGRILSKSRSYTDVYQGILARLCHEDFVLMHGREFLEVPYNIIIANQGLGKIELFVREDYTRN